MKEPKVNTQDWCLEEGSLKDYDIIRCIRSSFKWTSYLAKDKSGNRVALTYVDNEKIRERYRVMAYQSGMTPEQISAEANRYVHEYQENIKETVQRIKGLGSDHVAATYSCSYDRERDQLVVVSEYVPGIDIFYASGRLKPNQLINLFAQALEGLAFIHKNGFLHLNIKPSRIIVNFEGDSPDVWITNFGFAIPRKGYQGRYNGTLFYMAPEVILEEREKIDERADLFSFAATMYYCLTGRQPLGDRFIAQSNKQRIIDIVEREKGVSTPPSQYKKEVPPELDGLILNLLEKEPDRRAYRKVGDLLNFFYETWPEESRHMMRESTSTLLTYD